MDLPDDLIELQAAADEEGRKVDGLDDSEARTQQRLVWFEAAAKAQKAVSDWARDQGQNRFLVEKELRQRVRHPEFGEG